VNRTSRFGAAGGCGFGAGIAICLARTRDAYRLWVSEIMLQQTRVET